MLSIVLFPLVMGVPSFAWPGLLAGSDAKPLRALWEQPTDLGRADLFNGPWGAALAPDPSVTYTFVRAKRDGVNPGMTVRDPLGRIWHVKQAPDSDRGAEGPAEVTISRVLSAVGYHQPPVYYLDSFMMADKHGSHREPGGRFRLAGQSLRSTGT